jgi:choline dehydrogenase
LRVSTALAYLPAPGKRSNLILRCETEVADLVLEGARAAGVRLVNGDIVKGGRVVLCAGTYASPTLLLRSGLGPAADLSRLGVQPRVDLPGVGSNLADHPSVALDLPYALDPDPAPLFQIAATLYGSASTSAAPPDLQLLTAGPYPAEEESPPTFMIAAALLKPRSRGTVKLRSTEPTDPPRIELGYLKEQNRRGPTGRRPVTRRGTSGSPRHSRALRPRCLEGHAASCGPR